VIAADDAAAGFVALPSAPDMEDDDVSCPALSSLSSAARAAGLSRQATHTPAITASDTLCRDARACRNQDPAAAPRIHASKVALKTAPKIVAPRPDTKNDHDRRRSSASRDSPTRAAGDTDGVTRDGSIIPPVKQDLRPLVITVRRPADRAEARYLTT
jgi:hypothetical protein